MARWIHKESDIKEEEDIIVVYPSTTTKIYFNMDGSPIRMVCVVVPIDKEKNKFGIYVRLLPHHYYPIRLSIGGLYQGITIKELNFKTTYKFEPITIKGEKKITLGHLNYKHFPTLQKVQHRHPDIIPEDMEGGEYVDGISLFLNSTKDKI